MRVRTALMTTAAFSLLAAGTANAADGDTGSAGGYSFNSSTPLDGGAQRQLTVGDFHFWKITLKPGQRLDIKASVGVPGGYDPGPSPHYERLGVRVYDPTRQPILCDGGSDGTEMIYRGHATAQSGGTFTAECTVGTVDYKPIKRAGTYYVQVGIGGATQTRGDTLPLTVSASTGTGVAPRPAESWNPGTPAGAVPAERKPTTAATPPAAANADPAGAATSTGLPPWAMPGALAGGVIAALALVAARRRPGPVAQQAKPARAPEAVAVPAGPPPHADAWQPLPVPQVPHTHAPDALPLPPLHAEPSFAVPGGPPAFPPGQVGSPAQDDNSRTR
ncbi:hypothetical protein [Streptomyces poriferorum]|uniref:Uncharacterized protein n=1 Tax=Streptomyces poriferorum TaxID=2798799 RepID=A0ABY9J6P7_9ACTN|nr:MULTISPECIES: hypothetical protein [unclassified Streptomyces]MDP5317333.1 hypothetical protein [Streptomyces sp. Alt4]WLQ62024.1 hypothetical protein P8A19_41865 [Streptomyces sp. Alt2]